MEEQAIQVMELSIYQKIVHLKEVSSHWTALMRNTLNETHET